MIPLDDVLARLLDLKRTRIVATGASNTAARNACRFNWVDWLDVGLTQHYGRLATVINTGISGDHTRGLLARFDDDVALYRPHLVILTIGGNDANPENHIGEIEYRANLRRLAERTDVLGACVLFQTYYACDLDAMVPEYDERFQRCMDVIRGVALETGAELVDHHRRWERLRLADLDAYRALMHDPMHVNPIGNMLMGLDLLRRFKVRLGDELRATCAEGLALQETLDTLERQDAEAHR